MDKDVLETLLGRGLSLERIAERFGKHPSTVGYWVRKHGLSAAHVKRHAPRGGIPRERLEQLAQAGGSHRSIASDLDVSVATVRHWLRRYDIETRRSVDLRQSREGKVTGRLVIKRLCATHGETDYALFSGGTYRCLRCRWEAVGRRRKKVRAIVISEAGGRCVLCGYDHYAGALAFHHVDPTTKQFSLGGGHTFSLERMREEARKCVLLCANCHAEVEGGVTVLPARVTGSRFRPA